MKQWYATSYVCSNVKGGLVPDFQTGFRDIPNVTGKSFISIAHNRNINCNGRGGVDPPFTEKKTRVSSVITKVITPDFGILMIDKPIKWWTFVISKILLILFYMMASWHGNFSRINISMLGTNHSSIDSPQKSQNWRFSLFSLLLVGANFWTSNKFAGNWDAVAPRDVAVMKLYTPKCI